jgi:hypothetical protein
MIPQFTIEEYGFGNVIINGKVKFVMDCSMTCKFSGMGIPEVLRTLKCVLRKVEYEDVWYDGKLAWQAIYEIILEKDGYALILRRKHWKIEAKVIKL